MAMGRHRVWGCYTGVWLAEAGNKHLKWSVGDCLDLHVEAIRPGLEGRGWGQGSEDPSGYW